VITADDITAKTFFKALDLNDSSLLGVDSHEEVFISLKDEYYTLRKDPFTKNDLISYRKIAQLTHRLSLLSLIKEVYQRLPLDGSRREKLHECLEDLGYKMNKKDPKDVEKLFISWIGQVNNSIKIAKASISKKKDKKDDFSFGGVLVAIEHVIERSIDENVSLSKFVAYEKEAKAIINRQKQAKK
tara:strand:- start:157 stop:714 length:558 start_codon:yes stop_codon:yes gene_type:complete